MWVQGCAFKGSASFSSGICNVFQNKKPTMEQFVVICRLDKIINKVNNISEPVEIKLSNQKLSTSYFIFYGKIALQLIAYATKIW